MTTRATLFAKVLTWLRRTGDTEFEAELPTMLLMVENRIAREIRYSGMEAVTTLTLTSGQATLPTDCVEVRSLTLQGTDRQLELVTPEVLRESSLWGDTGGAAKYYAIHNRTVYTAPQTDGTLDISYWARFPALTADADTNSLLTKHFDLYLNAMLAQAGRFLQDREVAIAAEAAYTDSRFTLRQADADYVHSGSVIRRIGSGFRV